MKSKTPKLHASQIIDLMIDGHSFQYGTSLPEQDNYDEICEQDKEVRKLVNLAKKIGARQALLRILKKKRARLRRTSPKVKC